MLGFKHVSNCQIVDLVLFFLRQGASRRAWETLYILRSTLILIDWANIKHGWRHVLGLFSVFLGNRIDYCFTFWVCVFVSMQNKSLFKLVFLSLVQSFGEGRGRFYLRGRTKFRGNLSDQWLFWFLLVNGESLQSLRFLSALRFSELLIFHQVAILVFVNRLVIKNCFFFENILQSFNNFVECCASFVILFTLVKHDFSRWNRENANKLSWHAFEDFIVDTAGHLGCKKVILRHGHTEADNWVDSGIRTWGTRCSLNRLKSGSCHWRHHRLE